MPIKLISGAGGSLTVTPASTASNYTLTVPAVTANVITSGDSNTITQTMINQSSFFAGYGPAFSAYRNSPDQSITSGVNTIVQIQTIEIDTGGCFNNTGSTTTLNGLSVPAYSFMPNVAGYYQINANLYLSGTSPSSARVYIYKNGSIYQQTYAASGIAIIATSAVMYLNGSTDYAQMGGQLTATSPIFAASTSSRLSGFLARAA
jgi:hypothetical protein